MKFYPAVRFLNGMATFYDFWPNDKSLIPWIPSVREICPVVEANTVEEAAEKFAVGRFLPYQTFELHEQKKNCTTFVVRDNEEKKKEWKAHG